MRRQSDVERRAARSFVRQLDESDCGAACLAWAVRYFGGDEPRERLRQLSGTTPDGATLLGVYQAAEAVGLIAEAYEAQISDLFAQRDPAILHVVLDDRIQHFVVCFGRVGDDLLIGDPATGLARRAPDQVAAVWRSRTLITLRPGSGFVDRKKRSAAKRQWLLEAVQEDASALFMATLLGAVLSIFGLAVAVFSKVLIDDILPRHDTAKLAVGLGLLLLVLFAQAGMGAARLLILLRQARAFNVRITDRFLSDLVRLPFPFFSSRRTGDLIARLHDAERLQRAVTHVLGSVVIDALVTLFGLAFIAFYSLPVAAGIAVCLILLALATWRFHRPIVVGQRRVMSAHSVNKSGYVEAIRGIETIKTSNAERIFTELMKNTYVRLQEAMFDLGKIGVAFGSVLEVIGAVIVIGVLAWTSTLVLTDELAVGTLVAVLQMTGMIVPSARGLATANLDLQEAAVAFDRIHQLTSLAPEYVESDEAAKSSIKGARRLAVQRVCFRYPGRPALLDDVSFECARGELVLLVGKTGSGKSSMLRILQRLLLPDSGTICVNGCAWDDISILSWRDILGVVPQHVQIFSTTVLENIRLGLAADPRTISNTCEQLGFSELFQDLPAGYMTMIGEGGVALSGGQRQLVGLARALVRDAQILLLDEPTASMDETTASLAMDIVDRWRKHKIVIVASHASTYRSRADRVYRIEGGRMVQGASPPRAAPASVLR